MMKDVEEAMEERDEHLAPQAKVAEADSSVITYDPLTLYLREIRKYPILSAEEQRELAIRYQRYKDLEAAKKLITSNLRLVVKVVLEYQKAMREILDLIQVGNLGLLQALRKFDPEKRTKFSSYAMFWIKAYVLKFILDNWSLVKFGTTNERRKLFFNLRREKDRLERELADHSPKLLAEHFGVKESDVIDIEAVTRGSDLSLDAVVADDSTETFLNQLPAREVAIDQRLAESETQSILQEKFSAFEQTLKPKEQVVFRERLIADEPKTLQQIADQFGVTREAVRQLEVKIVKRLKEFLKEHLGDIKEFAILIKENKE